MDANRVNSLNEVIAKTNKLTGEIGEYQTLNKEMSSLPLFQRLFRKRSKKVSMLRREISESADTIEKLWEDYEEIEIPNHLLAKHEKLLNSAKEYFQTVIKYIQIRKEITAYGKNSFWVQLKSIQELFEIEERLKSVGNEWQIKAKNFNELKTIQTK